eukprot:10027793-Prorocentrum_lima.AAC.1
MRQNPKTSSRHCDRDPARIQNELSIPAHASRRAAGSTKPSRPKQQRPNPSPTDLAKRHLKTAPKGSEDPEVAEEEEVLAQQ